MRPHFAADAYYTGMFKWYGFLQDTAFESSFKGCALAVPAGFVSSAAWALLALVETVESIVMAVLNIFQSFSDLKLCVLKTVLSGLFTLTIPFVVPARFIQGIFGMIFDRKDFLTNHYDQFHRQAYPI